MAKPQVFRIRLFFLPSAVPKEFRSADFFWSFEDASGAYISHDTVQKRPARLMGGSRVVPETGRGLVASTGKARGWISLGDFAGDKEREIIYQPKENFGLNAKFL